MYELNYAPIIGAIFFAGLLGGLVNYLRELRHNTKTEHQQDNQTLEQDRHRDKIHLNTTTGHFFCIAPFCPLLFHILYRHPSIFAVAYPAFLVCGNISAVVLGHHAERSGS